MLFGQEKGTGTKTTGHVLVYSLSLFLSSLLHSSWNIVYCILITIYVCTSVCKCVLAFKPLTDWLLLIPFLGDSTVAW